MDRPQAIRAATYGMLALTAAVTFLYPAATTVRSSRAQSAPAELRLTGTVRDFKATHADFETLPPEGAGHTAGNVGYALASGGRPQFNPGLASDSGGGNSYDLVARWAFDEGAGATAADSGGPNDGTVLGGAAWTAGHDGGAIQFDGVDDYVNVPSAPELRITGDVTTAGWFRLDQNFDSSSPRSFIITEKYLDDQHDTHIALAGTDYGRAEVPRGALVFKVENHAAGPAWRYKWTTRSNWNAGQWYHFACALHSSDSAANRIFIDGIDVTAATDYGQPGYIDTDFNADIRIGGEQLDKVAGVGSYFEGAIDDFMIFSGALTAADVNNPGAGGYKVATQWRDGNGYPIAPHLAGGGSGVVSLAVAPILSSDAVLDTWDSSVGPYGGANIGPAPTMATGAPMPAVAVPTDLGPSVGDVAYADTTISSDLHCDRLTIDGLVQVGADITIICEGLFEVNNHAQLELLPGGSLTLYAMAGVELGTKVTTGVPAYFNGNTGDPTRFTIYNLGSTPISFRPHANVFANIISPYAPMVLKSKAEFFGDFVGYGLELKSQAEFHLDTRTPTDSCGNAISDTMGLRGADSDGGIASAASFDQWFRDSLGNNVSSAHMITLTLNGSVYEYLDDDFHPIDGRLFGNEGNPHNHHLTYALSATFVHDACTGQFVEFEGGDGAWLFIDGQLVIDLGGVGGGTEQRVELDRLGLADGQMHVVHLFYAQRRAASSTFRLSTNIELSSAGRLAVGSAGFD